MNLANAILCSMLPFSPLFFLNFYKKILFMLQTVISKVMKMKIMNE